MIQATFPFRLLIDPRDNVSYPDVCRSDSHLYIVYDRERGADYGRGVDYSRYAKEIQFAKLTEEDILAGTLKNPDSALRRIVSKLGNS